MTTEPVPDLESEDLGEASLPVMAKLLNRHHSDAETCLRKAQSDFDSAQIHQWKAGRVLVEVKDQRLSHGEFLPWLEANFNGTPRTAQRYMAKFRKYDTLSHLVAAISLRKLSDELSDELSEPDPEKSKKDNEWYTPEKLTTAATKVMGVIDLDPASNSLANETVRANRIYTAEEDGLRQPWKGRIWLNPPYSQPLCGEFCRKLIDEYEAENLAAAVVLVNSSTGANWYQNLLKTASAFCFPAGRIRFGRPAEESVSYPPGSGRYDSTIFYLGDDPDAFVREFAGFGLVYGSPIGAARVDKD